MPQIETMEFIRYIFYRSLFACLCTILFPMLVHGQNICINQTLQRIVEQIPELQVSSSSEEELVLSRVNGKCPIVVTRNAEGSINHVGFKLFNRKIMEKHASPLYSFIERYMLELSLLDEPEIATRLKMDRVALSSEIYPFSPSVKNGLRQVLSDNVGECSFYITNNSNRYVVSLLKKDKQLLQISLPVRYELITGFTKNEMESAFMQALQSYRGEAQRAITGVEMSSYKDSLYLTNEDIYFTKDFISTSYYKKTDTGYSPLLDSDYLKESVYNLFNAYPESNIMIELTQSLYGNNNRTVNIPLHQFLDFLHGQNCRIYTGIKSIDGSSVQGTVMVVNSDLGYQHLLSFTLNLQDLFSKKNQYVIKASMYCYIPIHNISSIIDN